MEPYSFYTDAPQYRLPGNTGSKRPDLYLYSYRPWYFYFDDRLYKLCQSVYCSVTKTKQRDWNQEGNRWNPETTYSTVFRRIYVHLFHIICIRHFDNAFVIAFLQ